jgi:hypothetical protein
VIRPPESTSRCRTRFFDSTDSTDGSTDGTAERTGDRCPVLMP